MFIYLQHGLLNERMELANIVRESEWVGSFLPDLIPEFQARRLVNFSSAASRRSLV